MIRYPEDLLKLIASFQKYPGIGPKSAERLALFTLNDLSPDVVAAFSQNLLSALQNTKKCKKCGMITDGDICDICSAPDREGKLMIVENVKDVIAFEKAGSYNGKYHVLNGLISPMDGIGGEKLNIGSLKDRIADEKITEVIIATSSTLEGEMTAMYLKKYLEKENTKIYRIGYGLPVGGNIEYADAITLRKSLESKKEM